MPALATLINFSPELSKPVCWSAAREPAVFVLRTGYLMLHKNLSCLRSMSGGALTLEPGLAGREAAPTGLQLTCEQIGRKPPLIATPQQLCLPWQL